ELILEAWRDYFRILKQDLAVGHFTMDNAANNTVSMKKLSDTLWQEREIKFDPIERQIPCFPHILNICVNHILRAYMNADFADVPSTWTNALGEVMHKEDYVEAVAQDPISICWNILSGLCLTVLEWEVLQDLEVVLEIPHEVQQCMSSESRPILSKAVPAFEMAILRWRALAKHAPHCGAIINARHDRAKQYYQRMGRTTAYCIAMFVDPTIRLTWVDRHWGPKASDIRDLVLHTMTEYRSRLPVCQVGTQPVEPAQATHPRPFQTLAARYGLPSMELNQAPQALSSVEQEFNAYVSAPLSPNGTDPLAFWEASKSLYPVVFTIALDYLPIQASSVPCECVFSSSSETDMKKHNCITPALMEALQMLKFGLKKERLDFTRGW
ncbi:hypothetical protein PISMIDRAFT_43550, partial [Pisolithus microcarpus 441]